MYFNRKKIIFIKGVRELKLGKTNLCEPNLHIFCRERLFNFHIFPYFTKFT
jgi:hypothetical protein